MQESRATIERHRARQQSRERRSPCRGSEFGALMNVLGLVPDDDGPSSTRDTSSGISRMREVRSLLQECCWYVQRDMCVRLGDVWYRQFEIASTSVVF